VEVFCPRVLLRERAERGRSGSVAAERVAVVTGATSGIGLATAEALASVGFHMVLVVRDPARGDRVRASIVSHGGTAEIVVADLSSLDAVRSAAAEIGKRHPAVHLLVNNAGAVFWRRALSVDGHERTFALNVLSPFLLTRLLEPNLRAAGGGARVVWVSSAAHYSARLDLGNLEANPPYRGFSVYSRSKLALLLVCRAFAIRTTAAQVAHIALHPGFVRSRFGLDNGGAFAVGLRIAMVFAISPRKAARTVVYAATSPELALVTGVYVAHERPEESSVAGQDAATGALLWDELSRLTGLPK